MLTAGAASTPLLTALGLDRALVAAALAGLRERVETVAVAESLTAGAVCAALTEVAGASDVLRGGLVVYATELKSVLASVDSALLARHGPVHPEVAMQLAGGARARCAATWGLGLTGVAGPDAQDGVAPGTVYVARSGPGGRQECVRSLQVSGDRARVRASAVLTAVELLAGTGDAG